MRANASTQNLLSVTDSLSTCSFGVGRNRHLVTLNVCVHNLSMFISRIIKKVPNSIHSWLFLSHVFPFPTSPPGVLTVPKMAFEIAARGYSRIKDRTHLAISGEARSMRTLTISSFPWVTTVEELSTQRHRDPGVTSLSVIYFPVYNSLLSQ